MKKTQKPCSKVNFGYGRQLRYALCQALTAFYGDKNHYGTRRAHQYRVRIFARYCMRQGVFDARLITQSVLDAYGRYLKARLQGEYVWPDGAIDKPISVAYAHNLVSTANTALYAMRGDMKAEISALQALAAKRKFVREIPAQADQRSVTQAAARMVSAGDRRGAAVVLLARCWGMRAQEAMLQDLQRMQREILETGRAWILEGCKGGRKSPDRWILSTPQRLEALGFALHTRPIGSRCLLDKTETVKVFYQRELNRCRRVLRSFGVVSYRELRAAFAADVYQSITGVLPMSGVHVPRDLDKKARAEVARVLGHGRIQVSSGYVGGY